MLTPPRKRNQALVFHASRTEYATPMFLLRATTPQPIPFKDDFGRCRKARQSDRITSLDIACIRLTVQSFEIAGFMPIITSKD